MGALELLVFDGATVDLEIDGRTALSEAVAWANEESIQKLATLGADLNFKTEGAMPSFSMPHRPSISMQFD